MYANWHALLSRAWLIGVIWLLAACSTPAGNNAPVDNDSPIQSDAVSEIQVVVATNDFPAGQPRIPFVLYDGPDPVTDVQAVRLTLFDLSTDPPQAGWQGDAIAYTDYEVPYWVATPPIPTAGIWGLLAQVTRENGTAVEAQFTVQVGEESLAPAIGAVPPASENRTLSTEPDITLLTTDPDPTPALYEMTVAEALASGRPTVVTFATPAFCQTAICTPVVNSVESVYADYGDQVNFIHIEIYDDFQELTLAEPVIAWNLQSEPWTFVLDADGKVVARLGGPVSPRELQKALLGLSNG
jgi:hypothetical protein